MVLISAKLDGLDETLARLERGKRSALQGSERTRRAWGTIGLSELEAQRSEFLARSAGGTAGGFGWKPVSPLTALLRRTGRTAKLAGWTQVVEIAKTLPIMIDTGRLASSLAPGAGGNVLAASGRGVEVGTNVPYARRLHEGGEGDEPAVESRQQADQVAMSRLRKTQDGSKPERTAAGRKSRAKRNWNPEFFRIRGWLRKIVGRVFSVPARPILSAPPAERLKGYAERVKDAVAEDLAR